MYLAINHYILCINVYFCSSYYYYYHRRSQYQPIFFCEERYKSTTLYCNFYLFCSFMCSGFFLPVNKYIFYCSWWWGGHSCFVSTTIWHENLCSNHSFFATFSSSSLVTRERPKKEKKVLCSMLLCMFCKKTEYLCMYRWMEGNRKSENGRLDSFRCCCCCCVQFSLFSKKKSSCLTFTCDGSTRECNGRRG